MLLKEGMAGYNLLVILSFPDAGPWIRVPNRAPVLACHLSVSDGSPRGTQISHHFDHLGDFEKQMSRSSIRNHEHIWHSYRKTKM
jgi:hypothetical protein